MNTITVKSLSFASAARMDWTKLPRLARYAGGIAIVLLITLIRLVLPLGSAPFLLYMPGVFAVGFLFGKGPGYLATVLSSVIALLFFTSPASDAELSWDELFGTLLYTLISLSLVSICDLLAQSLRRREADLEAMQAAKTALEESESFLRSVLASSPDCIKILDLESRLTFMNEGGKKVMEVNDFGTIESCPWPDLWQGDYNKMAQIAFNDAKKGKTVRFEGLCDTMAGTPRWWDVSLTPIKSKDSKVERILVTSRDITERKRAEAQQKLLNHELGHRLKNMLAMIQAVANQTLRRANSLPEASAAFDSRLIALGKAQDVLTETHWESAEINSIIRNALAPHGIDAGGFTMSGPSLMLSSRCSLALSLALHELATNATKYGALSVEGGSVVIEWRLREETDLRLYLEWREVGGPAVSKPERTGFGSFMIERSLSAYFKGAAHIEYRAGRCAFRPRCSSDAT